MTDKEKTELFSTLIHKVSQATRPVTPVTPLTPVTHPATHPVTPVTPVKHPVKRPEDDPDKALQAVCELLKAEVPHYDWVGFYLTDPNAERELVLGPFAGEPTEHVRILIVPNVAAETNYLSCSPTVKSEIVLPILKAGEVMGELDIDSHTIDAFSEEDRAFLLKVCYAASRLLYRAQEARRK
jgi:putative methionine-R-sulfoxide reductase with GAF domain